VKFADIEKDFGALSPAAEALLTRYFRVKVQSLHFCGKAFFDRPLIEGFRNLVLLYPIILWLARWLAVSDGRAALTEADVLRAISMVDHHYSYTPYLAWRTRLLQQRGDIVKLCAWYAR
jgi:lysine-N-methylase